MGIRGNRIWDARGLRQWLLSLRASARRRHQAAAAAIRPAVRVEDSVTPNFLVCLETGTRQVLLRRHLRETLRMTPDEYRDRWGLPPEYPMVAANYLRRRKTVRHGAHNA